MPVVARNAAQQRADLVRLKSLIESVTQVRVAAGHSAWYRARFQIRVECLARPEGARVPRRIGGRQWPCTFSASKSHFPKEATRPSKDCLGGSAVNALRRMPPRADF